MRRRWGAVVGWLAMCGIACALTPGQKVMLMGHYGYPGVRADMNFASGQYFGVTPGGLTVTRTSTESEICNGALTTFGTNVPAITPGCGLWQWESRTNRVSNNTMVGAGAGSPGTFPTNWFIGFNGNGLASSIIGFGTQNGIPYLDININGTATNTNQIFIGVESAAVIVATYGQTWTMSAPLAFVGGATTNVSSVGLQINEREGGSAGSGQFNSTIPVGSLPTNLSTFYNLSGTFSDALATYAWPVIAINPASTGTFNFTLRIGVPQLELNYNIPTGVASATVAGGGTLYTPSSSGVLTYNGAGCTTNPALNVTTSAGGVVNAVTSVAVAGVCANGLPAAGATTWTDGTGLGTGSGASFTLVPIDVSARAFATGPILTSGVTATRAAQTVSFPFVTNVGVGAAIAENFTPTAPLTYPLNQFIAEITDGTDNNRCGLFRALTTGYAGGRYTIAGSSTYANAGTKVLAASALSKVAISCATGTQNMSTNASAETPGTGAGAFTSSNVVIGANATNGSTLNGVISRLAVWKNALSSATLNQVTH